MAFLFVDFIVSIISDSSIKVKLSLGGNEQSTHKLIAELMGKGTIDTKHHSKSTGRHGSYSTSFQNLGRELLTPAEVRGLNKKKALLLISGEPPVVDRKYNLLRHPNVALCADGGGEAYVHGVADHSDGTIEFTFDKELLKQATEITPHEGRDFQLLDETELEELLQQSEEVIL